ncbi:MAG: peptidylprolyl isomerase [Propionibacteriaceae bacterium]|jgi:peptidyl-prolyl cis-trans isomerase B (cyclophilin B)|nr:peptidylprolyl isomerase [Propionibacteriaceae bacterium]
MKFTYLAAAVALSAVALVGCAQTDESEPTSSGNSDVVSCQYNVSGKASGTTPVDPPPTANVPAQGTVNVTLQLSQGPLALTLDRGHAPCTVNSFLSLLEQGYYTDTVCHRLTVQGIFILQCGDPTATGSDGTGGTGGPGYRFPDEVYSDDTYPAGTVAMANSGPDTNGSQFFLVYQDSELAPDYTVFGQMDQDGIDLVSDIAAAGVHGSANSEPNQKVMIEGYSMG